jgi:hypothetical protein
MALIHPHYLREPNATIPFDGGRPETPASVRDSGCEIIADGPEHCGTGAGLSPSPRREPLVAPFGSYRRERACSNGDRRPAPMV